MIRVRLLDVGSPGECEGDSIYKVQIKDFKDKKKGKKRM